MRMYDGSIVVTALTDFGHPLPPPPPILTTYFDPAPLKFKLAWHHTKWHRNYGKNKLEIPFLKHFLMFKPVFVLNYNIIYFVLILNLVDIQ